MNNPSTSNTNITVPPEEEELFKEFQSYVRSIYVAASSSAIDSINDASSKLKSEIQKMDATVRDSRDNYREMFTPALKKFEASSENALIKLAKQQDEIASIHWNKTIEILKQQSTKHDELMLDQSNRTADLLKLQSKEFATLMENQKSQFESYVRARIRRMTIIINVVFFLISIAMPGVLYWIFKGR